MNRLITEVSSQPITLFRIWNGGMINQLMSVELSAGICSHFQRFGMLFESCKLSTQAKYTTTNTAISLSEITEIPENLCYINMRQLDNQEFINIPSPQSYFVGSDDEDFAEGRKPLHLNREDDYYFDNNLANYSIMFSQRSALVEKHLSGVRFKNEYEQFALMVAQRLGVFNGIHLRFTDFSTQILKMNKHHIVDAFDALSGQTIVLASDDSSSKMIAADKNSYIAIESVIFNEFNNDFKSLSISNEVVLGLISMLVMTYSYRFIGTPKSTYSNYIHRRINQRKNGKHDWACVGIENPLRTGKYSWNDHPNMTMEQKLWQKEWPESLLRV